MGAIDQEDDDDDLEGFSGLADAAAKAWDELMAQRGAAKDVKSLFYLSELKDGVERAAKRVEATRQEAATASAKLQEKRAAIDDLCARIEAKSSQTDQPATQWKLKDVAIRRGKGLCDISMIHHEEYPPYFEVRMAADGSIVGTEAKNLVPLAPPQQGVVRAALRELEEAKAAQAVAAEAVEKAEADLRQQHQSLTEQVEQKLQESGPPPPRSGSAAGPPLGPRSAPQGMPDIDVVQGWAASATPKEGGSPLERHEYPEVRGVREDLRGAAWGGPSSPPAPSMSGIGAEPSAPGAGGGPPPGPGAAGGAPLAGGGIGPQAAPKGFPSFDDLLRMEKEAAGREKQPPASGAAATPTAHAGASREDFSRPVTTSTHPPESYRSSTGRSGGQRSWAERGAGQASTQEAGGVHTAGGVAQAPRRPQAHPQQPQAGHAQAEWTAYRTTEGQPYYYNERTGESAWTLPVGARCRDPAAEQQQQQAGGADDPFAHLRKKEEEMKQQREQWSQWYSEYYNWYKQQAAGTDATPPGAAPHGTKFGSGAGPKGGAGAAGGPGGAGPGAGAGAGGAQAKMPPKGPAAPTLDANFEDHATYAIKSSLLKEMEAMVEQGKPLGQRKKALRVLQIRWHPDKNPDRAEVANSVFQFIEETKPWFLHDPEDSGA